VGGTMSRLTLDITDEAEETKKNNPSKEETNIDKVIEHKS